mmetsp:Transcript_29048/g.56090  ORF Transcript_29048/g.56090 Transcript_29048/m.56090 type:complete len:356 (+) Transcript_29048:31-1098(+)
MPLNTTLCVIVLAGLLGYPFALAGQLPMDDDTVCHFQLPPNSESNVPIAKGNNKLALASEALLANASSPLLAQSAENQHDEMESGAPQPVPHMAARLAICGLCSGAVFGMMGSGGAMITKWMLYYVLQIRPFKLTIFTMYLILCPMSAFGALRGLGKGKVHWPHVVQLFVFASSIGTTLGTRLATFITDRVQLLCFGTLVLCVAAHILYKQLGAPIKKNSSTEEKPFADQVSFVLVAVVVGCLCGALGVGGGFMLVPILLHAGHDMNTAVPTSLAVITLNAAVSACWYLHLFGMNLQLVNGTVVASFLLMGCLGMVFSDEMAAVMSNKARQCSFAVLLLAIGHFTVTVELWRMHS